MISFKVATSLSAIAAGTTFGIFTLGMLVPWSNNFGAICGAISGALMSGWVSFGTQAAIASGAVVPQRLPMSTEGCAGNISSIFTNVEHDESDVFPLYRLSFMWINPSTLNFTSLKFEFFFPNIIQFLLFSFPVGILSVLIVGMIASYLSGPEDLRKINPDLISPVIHRFLPSECFAHHDSSRCASTEPTTELFTLKIGENSRQDNCHQIHNVDNS